MPFTEVSDSSGIIENESFRTEDEMNDSHSKHLSNSPDTIYRN